VTSTLPLLFPMNTFAYQVLFPQPIPQTPVDWMEYTWGGPYEDEDEDDFPSALCGESSCPGDCYICVVADIFPKQTLLPVYGPVNRDGQSLGFLLVSE
jgi:hypothetical protein